MQTLTPPPAERTPARRGLPSEPDAARGKPTPAMLRAVGDPLDGTPMTVKAYDGRTLEFSAELIDGRLDYLPMPDDLHARIVRHLRWALENVLRPNHPNAALAGQDVRLRLPSGRSREPDQILLLDGDDPRRTNACWFAADLCIEVVSPDDPDRDYVEKRADYAAAGVSEYWIVDPRSRTPNDDRGRTIHVLTLEDGAYQERRFEEGDTASGHLLEGFSLDVTACLSGA